MSRKGLSGRHWLNNFSEAVAGPGSRGRCSVLWFLDSVKRVLAAGEAPVVSLKGRRLRRSLSDAVRVCDGCGRIRHRARLAMDSSRR